jgi:hypothetical protein
MPSRFRLAFMVLTASCIGETAMAAGSDPPPRIHCRVEPGQPRPSGCAPFSGKALAQRDEPPEKTRKPAPRAPPNDSLDPRRHPLEQRTRTLLIQELNRLERLYQTTPENSPERARIVLRLADTFAELARASEIEALEAEQRARTAKPATTKSKSKSESPE